MAEAVLENPDLFDLTMSDQAAPLLDAVKNHIQQNVAPISEEFYALEKEKTDRWSWHPRQLELLDGAKAIDENAAAIVGAVSHEDQNDSAA